MVSPVAPDRESPRPADPKAPQPLPMPRDGRWKIVKPHLSVRIR